MMTVLDIQRALIARGYSIAADEKMGPKTQDAIRAARPDAMKHLLIAVALAATMLTAGCGELARDLITIGRCVAIDHTRNRCN